MTAENALSVTELEYLPKKMNQTDSIILHRLDLLSQ